MSTALPDPTTDAAWAVEAWAVELTEQQRCALPAAYHRPYFDGLAEPKAWICAVCWGEGWTQLWPCFTARENGVELAQSLGVGWLS